MERVTVPAVELRLQPCCVVALLHSSLARGLLSSLFHLFLLMVLSQFLIVLPFLCQRTNKENLKNGDKGEEYFLSFFRVLVKGKLLLEIRVSPSPSLPV